jgi:putative chitinase
MSIAARKASLELRLKQFGGPVNEPAVKAQFLAQVMHESGGLRYVREVWGPTAAQSRYEGRKDLGNTHPGDGKRFMGRDVLQVTGRANYRALTAWVRKTFGDGPDFEAEPEALESPEWLGIGAIWYFLAARKSLIMYCRDGNIEMVTRQVNGGLNGYADRLKWYDRVSLEILGYDSIKQFQEDRRLVPDGISGPKTRTAMHDLMTARWANLQASKPVADSQAPIPAVKPMPSDAETPPAILPDGSTKWVLGIGGLVAVAVAAGDKLAEWWAALLNMF